MEDTVIPWNRDMMLEVRLKNPADFFIVRETLTRMGRAFRKRKTMVPSCVLLQKQGRYYIMHFKEMFALDGRSVEITLNDMHRRNRIAFLLREWNLVDLTGPDFAEDEMAEVHVISRRMKDSWKIKPQYTIRIING